MLVSIVEAASSIFRMRLLLPFALTEMFRMPDPASPFVMATVTRGVAVQSGAASTSTDPISHALFCGRGRNTPRWSLDWPEQLEALSTRFAWGVYTGVVLSPEIGFAVPNCDPTFENAK